MAVAFVRTHTAITPIKAAGTTIDANISAVVPAGNLLVCYVLFDNAATASKPIVTSIAKAAGETNNWVSLGRALSTSTTAGAFASGEMMAIRTSVAWPVAAYTVTLDTSTVMKATLVQEFSGALATVRSTGGTAYSTTTAAASAATTGTAPVVGDLVLGFQFASNAAASTAGDTDTTGGAWSTKADIGSTGGNAATNNFGYVQYKVTTATTAQTFNSSVVQTAGNGSIVAVLQQYVDPSITQAAYRFYADGPASGPATIADTYSEDNQSGARQLEVGQFPSLGQSFLGDGNYLARAGFYLRNAGNAANSNGTITAYLYTHTGTFGTSSLPGTVLAVSNSIAPSSIVSTSFAWYEFDFGNYQLSAGTPYVIVLTSTNTFASSTGFATDTTSPTHAGNLGGYNGTTWTASPTIDAIFRVYTNAGPDAGALAAQDAAPTVDVSAGDVNAQVRVRLQSTTAVAVDPWDDFQLQWEKNASGTWAIVTSDSSEGLADNYASTNRDGSGNLIDLIRQFGQSFMGDGRLLTRAGMYLSKTGTPTALLTAYLYSHTGTFGSTGVPGTLLATSTSTVDSAALTAGSFVWSYWNFSPTLLQPGTPYFLVLKPTSGTIAVTTAEVLWGSDNSASSHLGNPAVYVSSWSVVANSDFCFEVYTTPVVGTVAPYGSPNLTDGAATTNRLTGGTGTFVAGKVSEDGLVDDLALAGNNYTELLYSLIFKQADLANGDTIRFRVLRNGATTGLTYTQTPTTTITKGVIATVPVASFTASATTVTTGGTVTFTDTSTNTPTTWAWNFGTGASPATAATQGPHTVTYSTVGTSTATLTAGNAGGSDTVDTPTSITVTAPAPGAGRPKAYVGGSFQVKPGKVWTGSAWVEKPWRRWDGTQWKLI